MSLKDFRLKSLKDKYADEVVEAPVVAEKTPKRTVGKKKKK